MFTPSSLFVLTYLFSLIGARAYVYSTAGLNTTWIANASAVNYIRFPSANARVIPIIVRSHNGSIFACGFYSKASLEVYFFAVFIVQTDQHAIIDDKVAPVVVWSANRNRPVGTGATLELTEEGDLVVKDCDWSVVWSTQTYGKSVAGINLTDTGNLVSFDKNNVVWQSFNHPTDTLLPGQKLRVGQKLTPRDSATNMSEQGLHSLSLTTEGLFAQVETDPPQVYFTRRINFPDTGNDSNYVEFTQGHFALFVNFVRNSSLFYGYDSSAAMQYLKFESDGHLRVYEQHQSGWIMAHDLLTKFIGDSGYPMVCGYYGICDEYGTCSCPDRYFKPTDYADPGLGCSEEVPLSRAALQFQSFLAVSGITYFADREDPPGAPDLGNTDMERCEKACANNSSCRAACFKHVEGPYYSGSCYLVSEVFSLICPIDLDRRSFVFLKVQMPSSEIQNPHIPSEPPVSPSIAEPPDYPTTPARANVVSDSNHHF